VEHDDIDVREIFTVPSLRKISSKDWNDTDSVSASDNGMISLPDLYLRETYDLLLTRWEKLYKDFYNKDTNLYDLTKVPDIYDMARYDVLHNESPLLPSLGPVFEESRLFSFAVVPQEYGVGVEVKRFLGAKMCHAFLSKILKDIQIAKSDESHMDMSYLLDCSHADDLNIRTLGRSIRTRLYFTSESHLHTLLNVLRYEVPGQAPMLSEEGLALINSTRELSYLTHIVFRMFERKGVSEDDPKRFRFEIAFSPGANSDPRLEKSVYLAPSTVINSSLACDDLINGITAALSLSESEHTEYLTGVYKDNYEKIPRQQSTPSSKSPARGSETNVLGSPDECSDEWETDVQEGPGRRIAVGKAMRHVKTAGVKTVGKPPVAPLPCVPEVGSPGLSSPELSADIGRLKLSEDIAATTSATSATTTTGIGASVAATPPTDISS
jgi:hypothetical protein